MQKSAFSRCLFVSLISTFLLGSAQVDAAAPRKQGTTQIPQVEEIDRMIREVWDEYNLKPSRSATDGEWCRRVYLDLVGRTPTVKELDDFVSDRGATKKEKLVEKLLRSDNYTEEYARNWTTIWSNILIGRTGGTENNSLINREGMLKYLRDTFARNKPYNEMVQELVSATGSTVPGSANFNGATNYLVMKVNEENAALATSSTSKTFLGLQVQCTQCHNHPFNEWKQEKFWEMNSFFRQTRALRKGMGGNAMNIAAELVDQDFKGEDGKVENGLVFYELRNGEVKAATPVFVDGQRIDPSGLVSTMNRRAALAKFMVDSEYLEKTAVNRMWSHFLGYGFTKPVDDMGPHNLPSHPALLDYLAKEFRKCGFDNKQLITWITLSEAYSLSSKTTSNNQGDDPLLGETPKFTHFYIRQMRAEELYESLVTATQAQKGRSFEEQERVKNDWLQQFNIAFGTDEGDETTSFNGTIPQVLMMFNGDLVKDATGMDKASFLGQLYASNMKGTQKQDYLFEAGLARRPTQKEREIANALLQSHGGNEMAAMQDLWWAILNSNEFIFNH